MRGIVKPARFWPVLCKFLKKRKLLRDLEPNVDIVDVHILPVISCLASLDNCIIHLTMPGSSGIMMHQMLDDWGVIWRWCSFVTQYFAATPPITKNDLELKAGYELVTPWPNPY
jgi:hypothetical protein